MRKLLFWIVILTIAPLCFAQQTQTAITADWNSLSFLAGKWVGEGTSESGQGAGFFTFEPDLQGKILIRKNHAEYSATKDHAAYTHGDLMIIYKSGESNKAFYTDNEGHVISYVVTSEDNSITFLSEQQPGAPRLRLTYVKTAPDQMSVTLESAKPDHPDQFQKIVEGKVHKTGS